MHDLPTDWSALSALVFLLGLKHGFDADHLAMIDGLTRYNTGRRRPFARYCGALFSLGHGVVVLVIAIAVALAGKKMDAPGWLAPAGAWLSIGFLTLVGVVNLRAVLAARPDEVLAPVGVRGRLLGGLGKASRPLAVAAVGSAFAISFDTVSQAALFSLAALHLGGVARVVLLAFLFTAGMVVTDAVNGFWVSRLAARADHVAVIASRVMSLAVAGASLLVAGLGAARLALPATARWSEGRDLGAGVAVCALMAVGYLCARWLARRECAPAGLRQKSRPA